MARVIGVVKELQNGEFLAKDAQNGVRVLKAGDQIFENDLVYGASNNPQNAQAIIDVTVSNASDITLMGAAQLLVDLSVIEGAFEKEEAVASKDAVDNAWTQSANTVDPNATEDPTAAGALEETAAGDTPPANTEQPSSTLFDARSGAIGDVSTTLRSTSLLDGTQINPLAGTEVDINIPPIAFDENVALLEDTIVSGQISADDIDLPADSALVFEAGAGAEGLSFNSDGSYTFDANSYDTLAQGEQQLIVIPFVVRDDQGATAAGELRITITGVNDVPVVTNIDTARLGSVIEAGHNDDGSVVAGLASISGQLSAADVDNGATLTWSLQGTPEVSYGEISLNPLTGAWTYTLNNTLFATQSLAEGEFATQEYTARVSDEFGAFVDQTIIVTIIGTNDKPILSAQDTTGSVSEDADAIKPARQVFFEENFEENVEEGFLALTDSGEIAFEDVDLSDTHEINIAPEGKTLGTLSATVSEGNDTDGLGNVTWVYSVDNALVQYLAEGETRTEVFDVTIIDDKGASDSKQVSITITGTNDVPTVTVNTGNGDNTNDVVKESGLIDGTLPSLSDTQAGGTFTIADADGLDDIRSISIAGTSFNVLESDGFAGIVGQTITTPTYGEVTIVSYNGGGEFSYAYTLSDEVNNNLAPATDTLGNDLFTISVSDRFVASSDATVTIDIVDDAPTITAGTLEPSFRVDLTNYEFASSAGYNSSFGYYVKNTDGTPASGVVIWDGVKAPNAEATYTITGYAPSEIGFFIIPDGNSKNSSLTNGSIVSFQQVGGNWQAFVGTTPLVGQGANLLFDNTALNSGTYVYMTDNTLPGNLNWEDIAGGGDRDNNDVNINADRTSGVLSVDESRLNVDATADFSSAFTYNFGADGAGTKTYALSATEGANTGLVDTLTNTAVTLHVNGMFIEGRSGGGEVVFTLSVDSDGKVTLDQKRSVFHADPNNPDDAVGLNTTILSLTATITDADGDSVQTSIDLGAIVRFEDDAPLAKDDSKTMNEDTTTVTGNILTNDFQGSDTATVSMTNTTGTYGSIGLSSNGAYTYTLTNANVQFLQAGQSVKETFNYTLTDKDGDKDQGVLTITIKGTNDAPIIDLDGALNRYTESFENLITAANSWTVISTPVLRGDGGMVWETAGGRNGLEVQNGDVGGSTASHGAVHAELDSHALVTLSTTVSISESTATLSFDYKPRPGSLTDSDMKVTLGGTSFVIGGTSGTISSIVGDIGTPSVTTNANGWISVRFTASGLSAGESTLSFQGLGTSNSLGAYLDHIELTNGSTTTDTGYETTFIENGTAVSIADTDITITDVDDTNIESATITLTNAKAGDVLTANTLPSGIVASLSGNVMTLTGSATLAQYQEAIKAITFSNTSEDPDTTDREISVVVYDGDANSNTAITIVHVKEINDPTVIVNDSAVTNEDTPVVIDVLANDSDVDTAKSPVSSVSNGAHGSVAINPDGTVTYTPVKNYSGPDSFTYTNAEGNTATVSITVNPIADAPSLTMSLSSAVITLGDNLIINGSFEDISGKNGNTLYPVDYDIPEGGLVNRTEIPGWKLDTAEANTSAPDVYFYNGDSYFVGSAGNLKDSTSSANALVSTADGYGISGGGGNDSVDKNETLVFDLHVEVSSASFTVTNVKGEALGAQWIAYDTNGEEVGRGAITDTMTLNLTTANTGGENFQYVAFDASASGNEGKDGFFVKSLQASTTTVTMPAMEPHDDGHAGVGSTDGENYMDLGASPGNSAIYQIIPHLNAGDTYQLSVDYRDKAAMQEGGQAGRDSGVMQILWNGAVVATIDGDNTTAWMNLTLNLTAIEGDNRLTFNEVGVNDDNWGMAIDNVQLRGVTYTYDLSVTATLNDNETLGDVALSGLPLGVSIANIDVESGVTSKVSFATYNPLSVEEINQIQGSLTSTDGTSVATTVEYTIATLSESGVDTLILPVGGDIDFSTLDASNNPFDAIEVIDLSASGTNELTNLSLQDVIDMTDANNTLTILGDSVDSVNVPAVPSASYSVAQTVDSGFDVYTYTSTTSDPTVIVKIDQDIQHS